MVTAEHLKIGRVPLQRRLATPRVVENPVSPTGDSIGFILVAVLVELVGRSKFGPSL